MVCLTEILDRNATSTPENLYLTRSILTINNGAKSTTDVFNFSIDFGGRHIAYDSIVCARSIRDIDAPRLWVDGMLADITVLLESGSYRIKEAQLVDELERQGSNILSYHPELRQAERIREQFFARVKAVEDLAERKYGRKIPIAGKDPSHYARELATARSVERFEVLRAA